MRDVVELFHIGSWYRAYGNDAHIISYLLGYKTFYDSYANTYAIGFPDNVIKRVESKLAFNRVNYILVNDSNILIDFGSKNNYCNIINGDDDNQKELDYSGDFTVKYEGDYPEESFIIGKTISKDAELTKCVTRANVGDIIKVNDERVFIIEKNIQEYTV